MSRLNQPSPNLPRRKSRYVTLHATFITFYRSDSFVQAKKPPAPAAKKTAPAAAAATTSKPSKGGAAPASTNLDTFKYKHTPEEAEELAADLIPSNIVADLGDANWKTRLAALEEMTEWVDGVVDGVNAEVVVRVLAKKGWAEKNFQVSKL